MDFMGELSQTLIIDSAGNRGGADSGDWMTSMIENWSSRAAYSDFAFLIVDRPALPFHSVQFRAKLHGIGD